MSFLSTLRIDADPRTRSELVALRSEFAEHVRPNYSDDVVDDFVEAFINGESTPALVVPAVQELVEWIHARRPELRFAARVIDEEDGDLGDWEADYGFEGSPAQAATPAPVANNERLNLVAATLFALAAVAVLVARDMPLF